MNTTTHPTPPENPLKAAYKALQDCMSAMKTRMLDLTVVREAPSNPDAATLSSDPMEAFARTMSADLTQPISVLSKYMDVSGEGHKGRLDPEAQQFMGYLAGEAKRMQSLVTGLSAYVEAGSGERVVVDSAQSLDAALLRLQTKIANRGAQWTHDPLPTLTTDPSAMTLVFEHLIDNAIRFCDAAPVIHISAGRVGGMWRFVVQDNGVGISPEDQENVFGLFFHKAEANGGPGIGLAVCQKIVRRLGGEIEVASDVGKGSAFIFTLPVESIIMKAV